MKLSKKIAILATALLSLALISCKTDTSETGSSNPNPTLPGIKGGKDNEKDIFAGKIFYDSTKEQAEYNYTKYTFSENGTVAITYTKKDDEKEKSYEEAIINYSLSKDGKIVYMTYNKICNPMGSNDKLYTYTEFEQYLYNDAAKETLDYLNNLPYSEEDKESKKEDIAQQIGLDSYTTDEELLAAMQKYSKEHAEEILTPIYKTFDTVFQYDLSKTEVDSHPFITEKNTWGKDLSKFISLRGHTNYYFYSSSERFSFYYSNGDFSGRYYDVTADRNYYVKKADSSKIYFEEEDAEGNTTKLEAPYTISDDGNTLTLTIDGKTIEAELDLDRIDLYQ